MTRALVYALALAAMASSAAAALRQPTEKIAPNKPVELTDDQLDKITGGAAATSPPHQPCLGLTSGFTPGFGWFTAFNTRMSSVNAPASERSPANKHPSGYTVSMGRGTAGVAEPYPL